MENRAFFFQGMSLLAAQRPSGNHTGDFPAADTFTIPAEGISGIVVPPEAPLPPGWEAIPVRQLIAAENVSASPLLRAFHIAQWRTESLFCGRCGAQNTDHPDELARLCPRCGYIEYPRIAPAVITLITNDEDQALLAHNRKFTPGVYSLIAGFVEAGENLESAVARETREEVGIELRDIQYAVSQPWPFPHSLMMGFQARYASGRIKPDGVEIEDARWFSRDNLPTLPSPGSVSRLLVEKWRNKEF